MKTYMMTLKRMMMTVLMMLMTVSAMSAEQKIWLHISGNGKAQVSLDGNVLTLDKENMAIVKDAAGLKVAVSVKPDAGYTVSSVTAQLTTSADNADTRGADDASFLEVTQSGSDYTFTMPEDFNVVINITFSKKGGESKFTPSGTDFSGFYYIANYTGDNGTTKGYDETKPESNYYLCPARPKEDADENYNYDAIYYDGNSQKQPYLTTYRTGRVERVVWEVEFATTIDNVDYYYIKYFSDNNIKYLTHNTSRADATTRYTVHLQETAGTDKESLFCFESTSYGSYYIRPQKVSSGNRHLNPATGNKNYYYGTGAGSKTTKIDGNTVDPGGMIGYYSKTNKDDDQASKWYLEKAQPTISYNSSNLIEISYPYDNTATIYYTTDGNDPPTTGDEHKYGEPFDIENVNTIKAIAVVNGEASSVASFTPTVLLGSTHKYIIQSKNCKFYNMIPNVSVDNNTKYVSALNVPSSTMAWHFEYAEEGYYYIVDANGWYMYYPTTGNTNKYIYLKSSKEDSDGYKFQIASHANGGYNIIPKGQTNAIYKNNFGAKDAGLKPVMFDGAIANNVARWDLIPYSTTNLPMWEDQPFTASTEDATNYYNIVSVSQPTKPLILNNSGDVKSETIPASDYDERKAMWVIKKVEADGLLDFYTLQNAYTGELLYYNGNGRNKEDNVLQLGLPSVTDASELWSHFVIVQTETGYNIIPRPIVDNTKAIDRTSNNEGFNCINRRGGNDILGTFYDDGDGSRWTFSQVDFCMSPVFTETEGNIILSCATKGAECHYTDDGTAPSVSSTLYSSSLTPLTPPNEGENMVIRAIAVVKDGETVKASSAEVTLLYNPDITLKEGENDVDGDTYTYDGVAKKPTIGEVSITKSENKITAQTTAYSVADESYNNNINAGENTASVTLTDADVNDMWYIMNAAKTFTIKKAPLTIVIDNKTKGYGDAEPELTYQVTGLIDPDTEEIVTGNLTRAEGETFGEYAITGSDFSISNTNYVISTPISDAVFTITPKSIGDGTIPAEGITIDITYDGNDYQVTVKQGDNPLEEGDTNDTKDYTWEGTGTDTYVVTVTGHGNYTNSAQATYFNVPFYNTVPGDNENTETAAAYCATQDLQPSRDIKAWYVTKLENNELTIKEVKVVDGENEINYIPANQPVLLLGDPNSKGFTLKPYSGTTMVFPAEGEEDANLLKVVTDEGGKEVGLAEVYVFSKGEFVLSMEGTLTKGKFYLENNSPAFSRSTLHATRGETTGINDVRLSKVQFNEGWYALDGQKLNKKPTRKGIYLQNGKKVVIK